MHAPLTQTRFRVEGMDCASCAAKIETATRRAPGIEEVSVSVTAGTMTVQHGPDGDLALVVKKVTSLGYKIAPLAATGPAGRECHRHAIMIIITTTRMTSTAIATPPSPVSPGAIMVRQAVRGGDRPRGLLTIASGAALFAATAVGKLAPGIAPPVFIVAMLVGLVPIAHRALMAALNGTPFSIEMLMTVAAVGAVFIGANEEAAVVVFLFLIGELLEGVAAGKARASIQALADWCPRRPCSKRMAGRGKSRLTNWPLAPSFWCGRATAFQRMGSFSPARAGSTKRR